MSAERAIEDGTADLVSFGLPFIANPDLPARLASNSSLAQPNFDTLYVGGENGYVDYPSMSDASLSLVDAD